MAITVNEIPRIHKWLSTILKSDATLNSAVGGRIRRGHAREGDAFPLVIYSSLGFGDDVPATGQSGRLIRVLLQR